MREEQVLEKTKSRIPAAYMIRLAFSVFGFIFILVFSARVFCQIVISFADGFRQNAAILQEQGILHGFGVVINLLFYLIYIHGVIGIYYIFKTRFHFKRRLGEKILFYIQIISSVAAVFLFITIIRVSEGGSGSVRPLIMIPTAIIGGFHFGRGFFNACITMGISVSHRVKSIVMVMSWIFALMPLIQIVFYLL